MPYIKQESRKKYDELIRQLIDVFTENGRSDPDMGDLNYVFSQIVWGIFEGAERYYMLNDLIGMLECVKLEFYCRKARPYEDIKIKENGDLWSL